MRLIFMATGEIALPSLRHLIEHGPVPLALVTQPDRPIGRHQRTTAPPAVKVLAAEHGIPVLQPEKSADVLQELRALQPEVIVVFAYGQILGARLIALPSIAIINLHASLLPRHRGAACIQGAIDAGDRSTGITSIHVIRALDAGDIIGKREIPIGPDDTGETVHDRLAGLAPTLLAETLDQLAVGTAPRIPQDPARVTNIGKLVREDGRLDWSLPADELERRIRAYHPWPGTFTRLRDAEGRSRRVKIFPPTRVIPAATGAADPGHCDSSDRRLIVTCGADCLEILQLQPEGSRAMDAASYLAANHPLAAES